MCENKKNVVVDDCLCFAINETLNHYKEKGIYPVQLQRGEVEENLNHSFGQWLSYMYTYQDQLLRVSTSPWTTCLKKKLKRNF